MLKEYLRTGILPVIAAALPLTGLAQDRYNVATGIKSEAPGTVFISGQHPKFNSTGKLPAAVSYVIEAHTGKIAAKGVWRTNEKLVLPVLPCGYYRLKLSFDKVKMDKDRSFAVVSDPGKLRRNPEMPYAIDSAQSWLCRPDAKNPIFSGDGNALVSRLSYLMGITHTRERLSWRSTETRKSQFTWQNYLKNADMLEKYGIKISGMFHDSPAWARIKSNKLPDDLKSLYDYTRTLVGTFKGKMTDWEFWNEQDIGFSHEGAWDYAACMKAAYLGFKAGDRNLQVLTGAFCSYPLRPYMKVALDNDLGDYYDIFNYHTYRAIEEYGTIIGDVRKVLAKYPAANKPIWITECGILSEGMGRVKSIIPGLMAHSPEQEMIVAEFLPKSQITMQSLGVAKCFFFVLPPYNEQNGNKDWGLLRRDYSVKPGYVAMATLTGQLGNATYLGPLNWGQGVRAFLFSQPDGSQTVAFWRISELDSSDKKMHGADSVSVTLTVKPGSYLITDLLGTASKSSTDAAGQLRLNATRYPAYISGLNGLKPVSAPPALPVAAEKNDKDLSIILKVRFSADFVMNAGKDAVDIKVNKGKLKLEVWNLSANRKSGSLSVKSGELTGIPDKITVKPWSKVEFNCEFKPEFSGKVQSSSLELSGVFDDRKISRLYVPVIQMGRTRKACISQPLNWTADPGSWKPVSSGRLVISAVPEEKAVKFDVEYLKKVDQWVYPVYVLQLPQESLRGAFGIAFEIKTDGKPPRKSVLMLEGKGSDGRKRSHWIAYDPPGNKWSERVVVLSGFDDLADIKELKIGMNPVEKRKTFYLRNIRILTLP